MSDTIVHQSWEGKYRILVVEDSEMQRRIYKMLIKQFGFHVTVVGTAKEGFKEIKDGAYDLAIIDFGLPDMTGIELAKKIRKFEKQNDIPRMILICETANYEKKEECLKAGFDVFNTKPYADASAEKRHEQLKNLLNPDEK